MLLLHEIGQSALIPKPVVDKMIDALNGHYPTFFPLTQDELPAGFDPYRSIACHCQLGTMHRLLTAYGINVSERVNWLRPWYLRYQIADGGLNCDEAAYSKPVPKSSVVSTLPPLEAMLSEPVDSLSPAEIGFLDCGASYLIERRLFRAASSGQCMDESWLRLCFPRFYHYDVLRGLSFLLKWCRQLSRPLPAEAIAECAQHIDTQFPDGRICVERSACSAASTRIIDKDTGNWVKGSATSYPLLCEVSHVSSQSLYLTRIWNDVKLDLSNALAAKLIQ